MRRTARLIRGQRSVDRHTGEPTNGVQWGHCSRAACIKGLVLCPAQGLCSFHQMRASYCTCPIASLSPSSGPLVGVILWRPTVDGKTHSKRPLQQQSIWGGENCALFRMAGDGVESQAGQATAAAQWEMAIECELFGCWVLNFTRPGWRGRQPADNQ